MMRRLFNVLKLLLLVLLVVLGLVVVTLDDGAIRELSAPLTAGPSPEPTAVPSATPTPAPDVWAQQIAERVTRSEMVVAEVQPLVPSVLVQFEMRSNLTNSMMLRGAELAMVNMACELRETGVFAGHTFVFTGQVALVDGYGNPLTGDGLTVRLLPAQVDRINCDEVSMVNLSAIADFYRAHPVFS